MPARTVVGAAIPHAVKILFLYHSLRHALKMMFIHRAMGLSLDE
jgi:hypothetical protein